MAQRFAGMNGYPADDPFRVTLHPDRLDLPLRWRKPRRIFVNSMSDLFHKDVPDEFIDRVFAAMARCPQHTLQVLTKRPERMLDYLSNPDRPARVARAIDLFFENPQWTTLGIALALPNVWLGVSVENQAAADERIPLLLQTPAAVRWISAEPLLGSVDVRPYLPQRLYLCQKCGEEVDDSERDHNRRHAYCGGTLDENGTTDGGLDWVIVGGESGPGARPMNTNWARNLRDQCRAAGIPFMFKQHGEWAPAHIGEPHTPVDFGDGSLYAMKRVGKKQAGRLLDGVLHDEYPEVKQA